MANNDDQFKKVISHAKEYGYVFQSSEIYDGLSAVYDYAQNGVELKKNIRDYWWRAMVQMHDNIVGIDAEILMHPTTWKASGHLDAFNDTLIDKKDSKKRYRADVLVEDYCLKIEAKIEKEIIGEIVGFDREEKSDACELVSSITGDNSRNVVSFGTEAGLFQEIGISTVVCGPGSIEQAHKVDEFIELNELKKCLKFLEGIKSKAN